LNNLVRVVQTNSLLSFPDAGVWLQRRLIDSALIGKLAQIIDPFYQRIDAIKEKDGAEGVRKVLTPGQKYASLVSSVTLGTALGSREWHGIFQAIGASPIKNIMEDALGGAVMCDLDQAWIRRQYAPCQYPSGHSPHGWHQDGALGYDFIAAGKNGVDPGALLPMLTCWIPLVRCGLDAPGLEFLTQPSNDLLPPSFLQDQFLRSKHPPEAFWQPAMEPGDLVLFRSGILHRTHVTESMRSDRTSIELRFVAAGRIPSRLAHDQFVPLE
jgi:hypothetical protein